jgi:hypothetical protein
MMPPMEHATLVRFGLTFTLGAALGCRDIETPSDAPDVHVHVHDAVIDDAAADATDAAADVRDAADAPRDRSRDLELRLGGWTAERGRRAELRLVDAHGALVSLTVLRAVTTGTERFALLDAMGAAPDRLDWFVDVDGDGRFGASDRASHAAAPAAPPYLLTLAPGTQPGDPAPLPADRADLVGHLDGFEVHEGVRFELRVTAVGSERTVALFRDEAMGGAGALDLRVPSVLRPGVAYRVFFFIDLNDNGVYDTHGDHGSGIEGEATAAGLTFGHDHHTNRTWRM